VTERKFELGFLMESIAFGLTDGVICFLGIIVGVARATLDSRTVIIAGVVGGIADALGNAIGFFVSQETERAVQIQGAAQGSNSHIHSKKEVYMSGVFSFLATILALALLLSPFILLTVWPATTASFVLGTAMSLLLGGYVGKLSKENPYKSALKYAAITVAGALISYIVGQALDIYLV
jgi:predicted membrane protein (TIGR00267 family)